LIFSFFAVRIRPWPANLLERRRRGVGQWLLEAALFLGLDGFELRGDVGEVINDRDHRNKATSSAQMDMEKQASSAIETPIKVDISIFTRPL